MVYSICLVPEKKDEQYLSKIISLLAKKYKSYPFIPHLTIYGLVKAPQKKVEEAVNYALQDKKPFAVKVKRLACGKKLAKPLFFDCVTNNYLQRVFNDLGLKLIKYRDFILDPHISLIYKLNLSLEEKKEIIKSIQIKKEIVFNRCIIISTTKPLTKAEDVKDWKIVYDKIF